MLVPNGKEQVVIVDQMTDKQALKVKQCLAHFFADFYFVMLAEGGEKYLVAARADVVPTERADNMTIFALGVLAGM